MTAEVFRRRSLNLLAESQNLGPYDEMPIIPAKVDLQLAVSRNDRIQPFFFCGTHDMVLTFLGGTGRIEFRNSPLAFSDVGLGDFVYVPARTPHRIVPTTPLLTVRYKPRLSGTEAAIWFCERCATELARYEYDSEAEIPQSQWIAACEAYNAKVELRTCSDCGLVGGVLDLSGLRWGQISEALQAERVSTNSQESA